MPCRWWACRRKSWSTIRVVSERHGTPFDPGAWQRFRPCQRRWPALPLAKTSLTGFAVAFGIQRVRAGFFLHWALFALGLRLDLLRAKRFLPRFSQWLFIYLRYPADRNANGRSG